MKKILIALISTAFILAAGSKPGRADGPVIGDAYIVVIGTLRAAQPFSVCMLGQTHQVEYAPGQFYYLKSGSKSLALELYDNSVVQTGGALTYPVEGCPGLITVDMIRVYGASAASLPAASPRPLNPENHAVVSAGSVAPLSWSSVAASTAYQVEISAQGVTTATVTSAGYAFLAASRLAGKNVTWRVRAGNPAGWGPWSETQSFRIVAATRTPRDFSQDSQPDAKR